MAVAATSPATDTEPRREAPLQSDDDTDAVAVAECDGEPDEPEWVRIAAANLQRERIIEGRDRLPSDAGLGAAALLTALDHTDPADLAAAGDSTELIAGILATERLINHLRAVQQKWVAEFARPGIATSARSLVTACVTGDGNGCRQPIENFLRDVRGARVDEDDVVDTTGDDLDLAVWGRVPRDRFGQPDLDALAQHPGWAGALRDTAARLASLEVGCALHLSPMSARVRTERALAMVDDLPATLATQHAGELDHYRAGLIADGLGGLTEEHQRYIEAQVLPVAATMTPSALRNLIKRHIAAIDPEGADERAAEARRGRGIQVEPAADDMATLRGFLPAPDAQLAYGVLDAAANSLRTSGLAEGRGASQLRADIFIDVFRSLAATGRATLHPTDREPSGHPSDVRGTDRNSAGAGSSGSSSSGGGSALGRGTCLNVYIDAATLAGLADHPGELDGYGCITPGTARALAASAETIRALVIPGSLPPDDAAPATHRAGPEPPAPPGPVPRRPPRGSEWRGVHSTNPIRGRTCDTPVDAGRRVYRPPDKTYHYVLARDRTCQFPGCRAAAKRCDVDHRHPYDEGGATCACNLDLLCRVHHRAKTFTTWHAEPGADGRLVWTSPTGHRYGTESNHPLISAGAVSAAEPDDPPPF